MHKFKIYVILLIAIVFSCNKEDATEWQFDSLDSAETGIDFQNILSMNDSINLLSYLYFYNGGGVATADFNNDGLEDLFFVGNQVSNELYLNKGDLKFEKSTDASQIGGKGFWNTGCSVIDINQDGLLDIYVNTVGSYINLKGHNELYVCQGIENGIPIYKEESNKYGLDLVGFGTQAAFFDMDNDGDLDMFQLNHSTHRNGTFAPKKTFEGQFHPLSGDRMFRNDEWEFTEITKSAGIHSSAIGYGLGIVVADINDDGWDDLYIGNDFHEDDYMYINQKDGTFKDEFSKYIRHTSRFSMGVDIADINNDGKSEIISLDMHPKDPFVLKSSLGEDGYDIFQYKINNGYQYQYARNCLQLNNQNETYSEIGIASGIYATDWSWAPLFMDFDNDGYKDIFISNGIPKRMNDIDYLNYFYETDNPQEIKYEEVLKNMPEIKIKNQFYSNNENLTFADNNKFIKNLKPTFSNGAVYADFDNDGDLDIVTNNINEKASFYENLSNKTIAEKNHYLTLKLKYTTANPSGLGAKVYVKSKTSDKIQKFENQKTRGFLSSVSDRFHIGLGSEEPNRIILEWPNGKMENLSNLQLDTLHEIVYNENAQFLTSEGSVVSLGVDKWIKPIFQSQNAKHKLNLIHKENNFIEFNREPMIPHMVSREGPALAVGDLNNDGLEDIVLGGAKKTKLQVSYQQKDGTFKNQNIAVIENDSVFEDIDAVIADFDNDGKNDLLVASGGNEYNEKSKFMAPRLYTNRNGVWIKEEKVFDGISLNAGALAVDDYNKDGYLDIFIGARSKVSQYGIVPTSTLLLNNGKGRFSVSELPVDGKIGFVTDAHSVDIDIDGDIDIVLALEWGAISILRNNDSGWTIDKVSDDLGWWNHVNVADFDGDGVLDILAGNLGMNSKLKPTKSTPVTYYVNDMDDNGALDQILTYYVEGKEVLLAPHAELLKQIPSLKKKFKFAKDFAKADVNQIFSKEKLNDGDILKANEMRHLLFKGTKENSFIATALPFKNQFSTINSSLRFENKSYDNPEYELLVAGNFYHNNIELGRHDASTGQIIRFGEDKVKMFAAPLNFSGEVRALSLIKVGEDEKIIVAKNNDSLLICNFDYKEY